MKTFNQMNDMLAAEVDAEIILEVRGFIGDESQEFLPFERLLGGNIHLIEDVNELVHVKGSNEDSEEQEYLSLLEGVPGFDACWFLPSMRFAFFMHGGTDQGGDSYFVPRLVYEQVPNIKSAIYNKLGDEPHVRSSRGRLMKVERVSPLSCLQISRMLPVTQEQIIAWQSGALIQDTMPQLTDGEREFFLSGMTEDEWDVMAAEVEEEDA